MPIVKLVQAKTVESDKRSHPRDLAGLMASLDAPNATARRWAARDLAPFTEAVPALVKRLRIETDTTVREAIFMTLTELGDANIVQSLIKCLHSEEVERRNAAIEVMKHLPDAVAPFIPGLLVDPAPNVRILAVSVLESLRHPDVEKWLIEVISEDSQVNVCATAVDILAEVGTEAAITQLEALKRRFPDEPYILFAADLALQRIGRT